jgi:hypothetical protein
MGAHASVIITPPLPVTPSFLDRLFRRRLPHHEYPRPGATLDLAATAYEIFRLFIRHGFLSDNAVLPEHSNKPTFATCRLFDGRPPNERWLFPDVDWFHLAIAAPQLRDKISEIVFTQTNEEFWDGLEPPQDEDPTSLSLPFVDIFVFEKAVAIPDGCSDKVFTTWSLIEFSFEDCRISDDIHRIRDMSHPFSVTSRAFSALNKFGLLFHNESHIKQ